MKNFRTFLMMLALVGLSVGANAQNYQTVNSTVTTTFIGNDNQQAESIRIDSSFVYLGDSIFYPFYNIQQSDYNCYLPFSYSWIGKKVIIQPDGYNYFINRENDTIKMNTLAQLNENWVAYETPNIIIIAEVTKHDTLSFLGQIDSAKTISFTAYDQNMIAISHPVNNKTIIISENFGLLKTINFALFSQNTTSEQKLQTYDLLGMSYPAIGFVNLTWREIYDFEIGDEIHIVAGTGQSDMVTIRYDYKIKYIYLNKTIFPDSIIYVIDIEMEDIYSAGSYHNSRRYTHDTITVINKSGSILDSLLSGEIINEGKLYFFPQYGLSDVRIEVGDVIKKTLLAHPAIRENCQGNKDSCWKICDRYMEQVYRTLPHYLKGLGGPYYDWWDFEHGEYRELQYYKKGNITWGTPLSIDTSSSSINSIKGNNNFVRVYPNPTNGQLTIECRDGACPVSTEEYIIYSVMGQVVMRGALPCRDAMHCVSTINVESLANGMYYLKIADRVVKFLKE